MENYHFVVMTDAILFSKIIGFVIKCRFLEQLSHSVLCVSKHHLDKIDVYLLHLINLKCVLVSIFFHH